MTAPNAAVAAGSPHLLGSEHYTCRELCRASCTLILPSLACSPAVTQLRSLSSEPPTRQSANPHDLSYHTHYFWIFTVTAMGHKGSDHS